MTLPSSPSSFLAPYETVLSPFLTEEDVIHEARRKRQRISQVPLQSRLITPAIPSGSGDIINIYMDSQGSFEAPVQLSSSHPARRQIQATRSGRSSTQENSRNNPVQSPLQEAMNELRAVINKIKKLARDVESNKTKDRDRRQLPLRSLVDQKVDELYRLLSNQLTSEEPRDRSDNRPGTSARSAPRVDDTTTSTSVNQDKRKRSRRIISLKRTNETMDVDMDP